MQPVLAQYYGFEYSGAVQIFMVGFAALALVAALFIRLSLMQWILAAILFFTALTSPTNYEQTAYLATWLSPVQRVRADAHLATGLLLTLIVIVTGRLSAHRVPVQGLFLLAINIYTGLMQFVHEPAPLAGVQTIGFAMGTVPCMLFAVPSMCRDYESCVKLLRTIMWVSVIWTVCCSVQFVINPKLLLNTGGRFWGMLGNAQGAAMLVVPFAVIALWLLLNDTNKRLKILWIALIAINLLFLAWTASRTGMVMLLLGSAFVLYNRMGRVVILLPFAALMTLGLSFLAEELQIGKNLERLISTENTRGGVWALQIANIMESPLIGVGWNETGGSESSWFSGFAGFGIVMFLIMIGLLFFSMGKCARLMLTRRRLPREQRPLIDLFCAYNAMYFGAATFEGIMLGRSSSTQTMMLMFAGIGVWLTEAVSHAAPHPADDEPHHAGHDLADPHASDEYGFAVQ